MATPIFFSKKQFFTIKSESRYFKWEHMKNVGPQNGNSTKDVQRVKLELKLREMCPKHVLRHMSVELMIILYTYFMCLTMCYFLLFCTLVYICSCLYVAIWHLWLFCIYVASTLLYIDSCYMCVCVYSFMFVYICFAWLCVAWLPSFFMVHACLSVWDTHASPYSNSHSLVNPLLVLIFLDVFETFPNIFRFSCIFLIRLSCIVSVGITISL